MPSIFTILDEIFIWTYADGLYNVSEVLQKVHLRFFFFFVSEFQLTKFHTFLTSGTDKTVKIHYL